VTIQVLAKEGIRTEKPTSLTAAFKEIELKREIDVIRFRTCCADPRASK